LLFEKSANTAKRQLLLFEKSANTAKRQLLFEKSANTANGIIVIFLFRQIQVE
jgi:hypothetical protein